MGCYIIFFITCIILFICCYSLLLNREAEKRTENILCGCCCIWSFHALQFFLAGANQSHFSAVLLSWPVLTTLLPFFPVWRLLICHRHLILLQIFSYHQSTFFLFPSFRCRIETLYALLWQALINTSESIYTRMFVWDISEEEESFFISSNSASCFFRRLQVCSPTFMNYMRRMV